MGERQHAHRIIHLRGFPDDRVCQDLAHKVVKHQAEQNGEGQDRGKGGQDPFCMGLNAADHFAPPFSSAGSVSGYSSRSFALYSAMKRMASSEVRKNSLSCPS